MSGLKIVLFILLLFSSFIIWCLCVASKRADEMLLDLWEYPEPEKEEK